MISSEQGRMYLPWLVDHKIKTRFFGAILGGFSHPRPTYFRGVVFSMKDGMFTTWSRTALKTLKTIKFFHSVWRRGCEFYKRSGIGNPNWQVDHQQKDLANTMSFYFQPKTGGFNPFCKKMFVKNGFIFPNFCGEHSKNLWNHHQQKPTKTRFHVYKFGRVVSCPETASSKSDRCDSSINASCHMPVFSHALMALL